MDRAIWRAIDSGTDESRGDFASMGNTPIDKEATLCLYNGWVYDKEIAASPARAYGRLYPDEPTPVFRVGGQTKVLKMSSWRAAGYSLWRTMDTSPNVQCRDCENRYL